MVSDKGVDVALDRRGGRGIGAAVVAGEHEQLAAGLDRRCGLVEEPPPAGLELAVVALGELRGHRAQGVDRAALLIRRGPQLAGGLPEPGRCVGHHERRRAEAAVDEITSEVKPGLVALATAEGKAEQHLLTLEGDTPGHEHALGRLVLRGA